MTADKDNSSLLVGKGTKQEFLALNFANRHGLIAGATGTGKKDRKHSGPRDRPRRARRYS